MNGKINLYAGNELSIKNMSKRILKYIIGILAGNKFVSKIIRANNKNNLTILYYHRVISDEKLLNENNINNYTYIKSFEKQMNHISKYFRPITEKEVIGGIKDAHFLNNSIWVTFDDGYKDNYENAYPILKKYNIPATFFIPTGYINKQAIPLEDYIEEAIRITKMETVIIDYKNRKYSFSIKTPSDKINTIKKMWKLFNNICVAEEIEILCDLEKSLNVKKEGINKLFMNWDEICMLSKEGYSIGAHTVNHKILSEISEDEIEYEIIHSIDEIEANTGEKVYSFAYPQGGEKSIDVKIASKVLAKNKIMIAVNAFNKNNRTPINENNYNLNRIGTSNDDNIRYFNFKISSGNIIKNYLIN